MPRKQAEERTYIPRQIKFQVLKDCEFKCAHCGRPLSSATATLEHIIPLSKGGSNDIENFVILCQPCNEEKSNDVVDPAVYYNYLPKPIMKRAKDVFKQYTETVRWLDYQTVFMTDRFDLKFQRVLPVNIRPGMPITSVPSTCQIRKLRVEEAQDALFLYAARLSTYDKPLINCDEKELQTMPYYGVYFAGKLLAVLSPYCWPHSSPTPIIMHEVTRPVLFIDFLPTHVDKIQPWAVMNLANILAGVTQEIQKTLRMFKEDVAIETIVRSPNSDKYAYEAMSALYNCFHGKYTMYVTGAKSDTDKTGPTITCAACILEKHSRRTLWTDNPKALMEQDNFTKELPGRQTAIIDDLNHADAPKSAPDKIKKRDKKRKFKKKRKHNT